MIKLVACDLDGTLFNSNMEVSEENVRAIHKAQKSGIEFLIATGRAPKQSRAIIRNSNLKTGFINLNGALVFDTNDNLIVKHALPTAKAKKIVDILHQNHFYFEIITANHTYSESIEKRIANFAHSLAILNPNITFKQAVAISAGSKAILNMVHVNSFKKLLADPKIEVMKIIAFDSRGYEAFIDVKKDISKLGDPAITSSSAANIEINDVNAQKGIALLDYAKKKGIKREEIAAIGDNLNDESMIREAGTGVAMGNAVSAIKKLAQVQTKSNNDNGVANILNKFLADNAKK